MGLTSHWLCVADCVAYWHINVFNFIVRTSSCTHTNRKHDVVTASIDVLVRTTVVMTAVTTDRVVLVMRNRQATQLQRRLGRSIIWIAAYALQYTVTRTQPPF